MKAIDLFAQFATDDAKEKGGVEVEYMGYKFLVARMGNRNYTRKLTDLAERYDAQLKRKDDAAAALDVKLTVDAMAETILVGWEGEIAFNGESLAYSVENAKRLLGMKDFRREVIKMADDMEAYKVRQESELGKP